MASKRPEKTYEEMVKEVEKLKLENRTLKQRVKESGTIPNDDNILSAAKRENIIVATSRALAAVAARKIEAKVRAKAGKAISENELVANLQALTLRVDVSMSETTGMSGAAGAGATVGSEQKKRRPRSKSRHRHDN